MSDLAETVVKLGLLYLGNHVAVTFVTSCFAARYMKIKDPYLYHAMDLSQRMHTSMQKRVRAPTTVLISALATLYEASYLMPI